MKSIFKDIFSVLKCNIKSIVIFELLYRIISIVLYFRIGKSLIGYLMKSSGYSYLTLKNLGDVLLNPVTYPVLLLLIIILIMIAGYEMTVLYTGFRAAAAGSNMKIKSMLFAGLKRFIRLFVPKNIPVLLLNAVSYVVLQIIPLRSVLKSSRRVSDAIVQIQSIKLLKAVFVFLILGLIVFVIYNAFVACFHLYGKKEEVFKMGHGFWRGKCLKTGVSYVAGLIVYLLVYAIIYIVSISVVFFLVMLFTTEQYEIVMIDKISKYIKIIIAYLGSIVSIYGGIGITVAIFYHYNEEQRKNIVVKNTYEYKPWMKRVFAVFGIIVGIGTVGLIADTVINGNMSGLSGITVMSHRGDSFEAPENTIPAVERAIENMSDYVEIDIHETKDGEIVVIHDSNLKRTTGVNKQVKNMTYEEIRKLDAGSYFSREFAGTKVPTLEEVLEVCKSKVNVNIEIKSDAGDETQFIKKITDIVEKYNMEEQCIFQSSKYSYLKKLKSYNVDLQTGLIVAAGFGNYFEDTNIDFFSINSAYINSNIVNMAHKYGKRIYAWTVNSYDELIRMKKVGVDGLITDKPLYAKEVLEGSEESHSLISYIKMHMK